MSLQTDNLTISPGTSWGRSWGSGRGLWSSRKASRWSDALGDGSLGRQVEGRQENAWKINISRSIGQPECPANVPRYTPEQACPGDPTWD